MAASAALAWDI